VTEEHILLLTNQSNSFHNPTFFSGSSVVQLTGKIKVLTKSFVVLFYAILFPMPDDVHVYNTCFVTYSR
jgi:hypothetical protein